MFRSSILLTFGLVSTLFIASCGTYSNSRNFNSNGPSMPNEAGKCYTKVLVQSTESETEIVLPVYTGNDAQFKPSVERRTVVIEEGSPAKWVKKKADRNCLSADPNDCLVWCLVETKSVYEHYDVVIDTTINKDFEIRRIVTRKSSSGNTDWREVVCENEVDSELFTDIGLALISKDFLEDDAEIDSFSPKLKAALAQYQRNNGLASGALTIESLIHLGVYTN